jgi:hypothetical protein
MTVAYGRNEASPLIVGEYGVQIHEYQGHPSVLNDLFNWIKPYADGMFDFQHPFFSDENYGLVEWEPVPDTTRWQITGSTPLDGPFRELINGLP